MIIKKKLILCASDMEPVVEELLGVFSYPRIVNRYAFEIIRYDYSSLAKLGFQDVLEINPDLILLVMNKIEPYEGEHRDRVDREYRLMKDIYKTIRHNSIIPIIIISRYEKGIMFQPTYSCNNENFPSRIISPYHEPQGFIFSSRLPERTTLDVHLKIPFTVSDFMGVIKNLLMNSPVNNGD